MLDPQIGDAAVPQAAPQGIFPVVDVHHQADLGILVLQGIVHGRLVLQPQIGAGGEKDPIRRFDPDAAGDPG